MIEIIKTMVNIRFIFVLLTLNEFFTLLKKDPKSTPNLRSFSGMMLLLAYAPVESKIVNIDSTRSGGDSSGTTAILDPMLSDNLSIPSRSSFPGNSTAINEYPDRKNIKGKLKKILTGVSLRRGIRTNGIHKSANRITTSRSFGKFLIIMCNLFDLPSFSGSGLTFPGVVYINYYQMERSLQFQFPLWELVTFR